MQGTTETDIDAMAVVSDLKQLQAAILDDNLERGGASIDGIFNQFLQGIDRGDYDFTGSDFVNNILIKRLDRRISCGSDLGLFQYVCYLDPLWGVGGLNGVFSFPLSSPRSSFIFFI